MSKFLQMLMGMCVLAIALSLVYYFILFLPQQTKEEQLLTDQAQCAKQADIAKINFLQGSEAKSLDLTALDLFVSNHFNQNLNKCLVEFTFSSCIIACIQGDEIDDAYENKPLMNSSVGIGKPSNSGAYENYMPNASNTMITSDDYAKLSKELMTE